MAVKEVPTNIRDYYKIFKQKYKEKLDEANSKKLELEESIKKLYNEANNLKDIYKKEFNIDIENYEEFINNKYSIGRFFKLAKGVFINKQNNYELIADLYILYDLASKQKEIYELEKDIEFYDKCANIKQNNYIEIVRTFYTEVHKKLILEGKGYAFSNNIGWICISRCLVRRKRRKMLDYAATKKREKELLAQGKRIYNKEEAEWCLKNGIEYKAEDKRVFKQDEACYQIPLIGCKLNNGRKIALEPTDYRHINTRGKTNDELIELCNRDLNKICELNVDLKTKLSLCNKVDKTIYIKFIRNEDQKPYNYKEIIRKD